jgi:hypothetical protein
LLSGIGLAVGTQLNFGSASYHEYKCSPSEQFDGFIWCQKARTDKERRGSYIAGFSLLHSQDGNISYINRSQEPAFFNPKEAELDIQRYSRKLGESPRIMKMPHRNGLPDGVIAVWGKITLEPLDQESVKILANGKKLIDYLRNLTRSAQKGLPIYRIDGGPGFIWAASFDQKGRGTLRLAAVQVSGFSPPPAPAPVVQTAAAQQEQLPPPAPVAVQTAAPPHQEQLPSETNQTIEKLQADLVISTNKISELERAKSDAEQAVEKAEQAKLNAENAKQEVEQARIAEKMSYGSNAIEMYRQAGIYLIMRAACTNPTMMYDVAMQEDATRCVISLVGALRPDSSTIWASASNVSHWERACYSSYRTSAFSHS